MRNPQAKILTLDQAVAWREALRRHSSADLVVTNGCFDLLHRGHCDLLYAARKRGDALLVLLNSDSSVKALKGPERPIVHQADRAFVLASLGAVSAVVIFGGERCAEEVAALAPDIYIKGGDYTPGGLDPSERAALDACGARIECLGPPTHSTTELVEAQRKLDEQAFPLIESGPNAGTPAIPQADPNGKTA